MFTIDQKVGKYTYVYEVHSYWDKEKKGPRQQRIRIGKRDPKSGEFIKLEQKRRSREYGTVYLLASIIERLGLKELLSEEFPSEAREIIIAACFQISEHRPFYLCANWLEHIYLREPVELSSQRISRLLQDIGEDERAVYRFLDEWAESREENKFIVFDITSELLVYGEPSTLPLLYSLYPGSVPDVVTLKNMKKRLERIANLRALFVLDRGFYSLKNLDELESLGPFLIPLPMSTNAARELVSSHRSTIGSPDNAFQMGKQIYYSISDELCMGENTFNAHIFFNEKQASEEREKLMTFLLTVEDQVAGKKWSTSKKLIHFLEDGFPGWQHSFSVIEAEEGYTVARRKEAINEASKRQGIFILITNTNLTAEQCLEYYRRKDGVEKLFDSMKHGIDMKRLRVHSRKSVQGLLFIEFISLIIYSEIQRVLRESGLGKKLTVEQMLYELKKLSVLEIDDKKPMITELTKKQKDIFGAFEIPLPMLT